MCAVGIQIEGAFAFALGTWAIAIICFNFSLDIYQPRTGYQLNNKRVARESLVNLFFFRCLPMLLFLLLTFFSVDSELKRRRACVCGWPFCCGDRGELGWAVVEMSKTAVREMC